MQSPNQSSSKTIIDGMMPSVWATYSHSMKSSFVGFWRVVFSYQGTDERGDRVKKLGLLWMALVEVIRIPWSCIKLAACLVTLAVAIVLLAACPLVNLLSLPFYRRRAKKELTKFIEDQEQKINAQKKRAEEALGGAV